MKPWKSANQKLNPEQSQCVSILDGPLVLLAGAGTGKTRVITLRIAQMIHSGIAPQSIVALTFTNKAAREMKERVTELCSSQVKDITISTFHSFCLSILRKFSSRVGLTSGFSILGTADQKDLLRRCLGERGWHSAGYSLDGLQAAVSFAKNQLWSADQIVNEGGTQILRQFAIDPAILREVFSLYQRQLAIHNGIDFDDCIYRTVLLLREDAEIKSRLEKRFLYMMVDEFQDTNYSQLSVIELLCLKHRNICVVGDDDQSIYSWRGAMPTVLSAFEAMFPERTLVKLEQNYRCTNVILNAANAVIKNNSERKDKNLWSENHAKNPIVIMRKADEIEEARAIAQKIMMHLGRGVEPKDITVLYRANQLSRNLEIAFREANLDYEVFGGQSLFERKEIKDILAYIKLISNPRDRLSFLRVINTPSRGIGIKTLEDLVSRAEQTKCSLFDALNSPDLKLNKTTAQKINDFRQTVLKLNKIQTKSPEQLVSLVNNIIEDFSLESDIRVNAPNPESAQRRIEALRRVADWLSNFAKRYSEDRGEWDLFDMLNQLTLGDAESKDSDRPKNKISLMTIHAAKGLEFLCVFVCGLEDGIFPHRNSLESGLGVAEERRLFYVALTRAKEFLYLSYARSRNSQGELVGTKPSRFLAELPLAEIQDDGALEKNAEVTVEEKKERTRTRLSMLRKELGAQ